MQVINNITDVHFYVFSHKVLSVLVPFYEHQRGKSRNKSLEIFTSLKDEFIPWLIKAQFCFPFLSALVAALQEPIRGMSESFLAGIESDTFRGNRQDKALNDLSCIAYKLTQTDSLLPVEDTGGIPYVSICQRANNLAHFMELNRLMAKNISGSQAQVPSTCRIAPKSQVGADCFLGESCTIGEKCSIKRSVVGSHCQIGNMVKLSNCVVLDYVQLNSNINLTNCIIGSHVIIHERTTMKDCEVAHHASIQADSTLKGEVITHTCSDSEDSFDFQE